MIYDYTTTPLTMLTTIGLCRFLQIICGEENSREEVFMKWKSLNLRVRKGFVTENISQNNWIIISILHIISSNNES